MVTNVLRRHNHASGPLNPRRSGLHFHFLNFCFSHSADPARPSVLRDCEDCGVSLDCPALQLGSGADSMRNVIILGLTRMALTTPLRGWPPFPTAPTGCETEFFTFLAGQRCRWNWIVDARFAGCSALNSWAAQQRRPTDGVKNSVSRPHQHDDVFVPCQFADGEADCVCIERRDDHDDEQAI